jgi:ABC-type multidrug transport system permease subunit
MPERRLVPHSRSSALWQLTACRIKEFLREPEAVFWVFAFPLLLAVALGFAFREKPPDRIPIGVIDGPGAAATLEALSKSPVLLPRLMPDREGREALRTGRISLLVAPGAQSTAAPVFHFDETRPDSRIARLEADDALQRAAGRKDPLAVRSERLTEKGSRYIDFLIPGLLGMNLMGTGIWSTAFSIVISRNRKVLKRLVATPMRRSHFLLSQIFARLLFLILELALVVGFGWIAFGVAVRGSFLLLLATTLVGAMAFSGIGLLIAARPTTVEGVSGIANLVMMPMWLLSGVFFSSERFPDVVQPLIHALPLTALNDALRGVINEAQGLTAVGPKLLILGAWGLVSFAVALKIFRWK